MDEKRKVYWRVLSEEPAEEVKTVSADKYTKAKVRLDPGAFVMVDVFGRGRR